MVGSSRPPCHEVRKSSVSNVSSVSKGRNPLKPIALRCDIGPHARGRQRQHDRAVASAPFHRENELKERIGGNHVADRRSGNLASMSGSKTHFNQRG